VQRNGGTRVYTFVLLLSVPFAFLSMLFLHASYLAFPSGRFPWFGSREHTPSRFVRPVVLRSRMPWAPVDQLGTVGILPSEAPHRAHYVSRSVPDPRIHIP
jgi:hypothetical protein